MAIILLFVAFVVLSFETAASVDYLDKNKTFCVRGIMMVAICFSHVFSFKNGNYVLRFLFPATVAPFFFYSGYGLALKTEQTCTDVPSNPYFDGFFRKRLSRMFCSIAVINVIFVAVKAVLGRYSDVECFVRDITNIGWFAATIIVFYIAFYFLYRKRILRNYKYNIIAFFIFLLAFIVVCRKIGLSSVWYGNSFAFLLGLIWAHERKKFDRWLLSPKHYLLLLFACAITLVACNIIVILREKQLVSIAGPGLLAIFLLGIVYPTIWNLLLIKLDFRWDVWYKIGVISFEMYMIEKFSHPVAEYVMDHVGVRSEELFGCLSLGLGLVFSIVVFRCSRIMRKFVFKT